MKTDPEFWMAHMEAGSALYSMGRFAEAAAELVKARTLNPDSTLNLSVLGMTLVRLNRRSEAVQLLDGLKQMSARQYVSPVDIASVCVALGDREEAFQYLEKAWYDKSEMLLFMRIYPPLESLRDDPRFRDLVQRVGVGQ